MLKLYFVVYVEIHSSYINYTVYVRGMFMFNNNKILEFCLAEMYLPPLYYVIKRGTNVLLNLNIFLDKNRLGRNI